MSQIILFFLFAALSLFSEPYIAKNYEKLKGMPGFSDDSLSLHFKLYQGYVKNTNALLAQLEQLDPTTYEYGALKRRVGWEFDGMRLHEYYFDNLGGDGSIDTKSALYKTLIAQFGSFEKWKKEFIATGLIRGIGWVILYYDTEQKRLINCWINEHDGAHLATAKPILIMDVFEHAYMPQYGLERAKYIDAFFANINWRVVSERFQ